MTLDVIVAEVDEPTPRGIAAAIAMLIRTGELPPGTRLPTVRELGAALGVSPATVSHAWQALHGAGLVKARGRAGTVVLEPRTPPLPGHSRGLAARATGADPVAVRLDLAGGQPDPLLLPDIRPSLERVAPARAAVTSYLQPPLLPELDPVLRELWPYDPRALTVVDGAMDGVQRTLAAVSRFGDRVVVESPGFPLLLDLLAHMHLEAVPVALDERGMRPEALRLALDSRPAAVVLQPRAQNPTGASMDADRARELAEVLVSHPEARDVTVIEDDHSGAIATASAVSLGSHLPERTVRILGFSKALGPDLRIAALGAPQDLVDELVAHRVLGPGWTSRLIQSVVLDLLTHDEPRRQIARARHAYYVRQRELSTALTALGLPMRAADGLNVWMPVGDERRAQVNLAAHGIRVTLGSAFDVTSARDATAGPAGDHVRVSIGMLRSAVGEVAAALARAAA
ncbi:aminotransferase class I/II-fold pyridoxal phosphate-dependent enzyme [Demequina sp. NBRC 110056]|uniref:aminotransferase class I/II-fold pyridoxal phosphate-dependent enzyme n=1 Tax=Demequina sp. NBRC 110056 TaxID=1570345 RepID=UPI0009FD5FDD|nr:aminotransferase class I/II-fold pyridoxal phosphate-dependent enzyme [Demequina sp. NBRC 110056]